MPENPHFCGCAPGCYRWNAEPLLFWDAMCKMSANAFVHVLACLVTTTACMPISALRTTFHSGQAWSVHREARLMPQCLEWALTVRLRVARLAIYRQARNVVAHWPALSCAGRNCGCWMNHMQGSMRRAETKLMQSCERLHSWEQRLLLHHTKLSAHNI